ncbi:MAG TPA: hypothetical protein VF104_05405 [Burkholderiales bacterium]
MKLLIAAGCPGSGWEAVVPILQRAGLEPADDRIADWLDELFRTSGEAGGIELRRPLQPDDGMAERATGLLPITADKALMLADGRNLWLLDFWAARFPQARFLLFFERADMALARVLCQGAEAQGFIEGWEAGSRQLLEFQRRHRRRALLLDAEAAVRRPDALVDAARQGGMVLTDSPDWPAPAPRPPAPERLLAAYLIARERRVETLHAELEASALPLRGESSPSSPVAEEPLDSYRQWRDDERELGQRLDDTAGRLQQALSALDTSELRLREGEALRLELDARHGQLQAQWAQAQQALQVAEAFRLELAQENELLLMQLGQLHADLDRAHAAREARETALAEASLENARLVGELQQARGELEAGGRRLEEGETLLRELGVRHAELQAQLEQAQQALQGTEASRNDLAQENELLLMQLGQLQEEAEHYAARYREAVGRLQARDRENEALGQRLADIQRSVLWRAIARLRALAAAFKRAPDQERVELKRQVELIDNSGLFDREWYLAQYGDVRRAGIDPVRHYLMFGAAEGRNPSPEFDTRFYVATYHDVAEAGTNPLVHFIKFGRGEGRKPLPLGRSLGVE